MEIVLLIMFFIASGVAVYFAYQLGKKEVKTKEIEHTPIDYLSKTEKEKIKKTRAAFNELMDYNVAKATARRESE